MSKSLLELAQWIQRQPWNEPGTDKTWVLRAMEDYRRFQAEVRLAGRVGSVGAR